MACSSFGAESVMPTDSELLLPKAIDVYRGLAAARVALVAAPQLHRRRVTVRWLLS
jgi:hypothetical protein